VHTVRTQTRHNVFSIYCCNSSVLYLLIYLPHQRRTTPTCPNPRPPTHPNPRPPTHPNPRPPTHPNPRPLTHPNPHLHAMHYPDLHAFPFLLEFVHAPSTSSERKHRSASCTSYTIRLTSRNTPSNDAVAIVARPAVAHAEA
jgi:hypothetical protein